MEKTILILITIGCIAVGCASNNKDQSPKEIAYEALSKIIKPSDPTSDSIYVVMPFGGVVGYHEIFVSKSVIPIHLEADFEVDTINGMKVILWTWEELKDTIHYQKSIDAGIVVLDNQARFQEDRNKNFVIIQCLKNHERGVYKLVDYEESNNKSQIVNSLCSK